MKIGSDGLKRCSKCGELKPADEFYKNKSEVDGLAVWCSACERAYQLKPENRARAREYQRAYQCRRRGRDAQFRLTTNLRTRLLHALANGQKQGSAVRDLGCSVEDLKKWLESKFEEGMSWANYGGKSGWQIDHIRPLSSFDLTDPDQFKTANHFSNLQPLWAADNYDKHDKLNWNKKEKI